VEDDAGQRRMTEAGARREEHPRAVTQIKTKITGMDFGEGGMTGRELEKGE
jgi:hypothetical protein